MPVKDEGKSSLLNETGVVVGFGHAPHPMIEDGFMSLFIVRTRDKWVICLTEGKGTYNVEQARDGLRKRIEGKTFAPYAARGMGAELPFWRMKTFVASSMKDFTMEWVGEDEAPWAFLDAPKEENGGTNG